jgi:hypothetical protein
LSSRQRARQQAEWNADPAAHWRVENGVVVNDGKGVFLTTDALVEFVDIYPPRPDAISTRL